MPLSIGSVQNMSDTNEAQDLRSITDLSEMIEKLKNNPEIVSNVASALGLGSPPPRNQEGESSSSQVSEMLSAVSPLISSSDGSSRSDDQRLALLLALRPYLNPARQEIIDYIIKFSKIGDLLKKLK